MSLGSFDFNQSEWLIVAPPTPQSTLGSRISTCDCHFSGCLHQRLHLFCVLATSQLRSNSLQLSSQPTALMKLFGLQFPLASFVAVIVVLLSMDVAVSQDLPDGYVKVWVPDAIQQQLGGPANTIDGNGESDLARLARARGLIPSYRKRSYYGNTLIYSSNPLFPTQFTIEFKTAYIKASIRVKIRKRFTNDLKK